MTIHRAHGLDLYILILRNGREDQKILKVVAYLLSSKFQLVIGMGVSIVSKKHDVLAFLLLKSM